jgi:hypothetical protein
MCTECFITVVRKEGIFAKRLLILLPFNIMRYDDELDAIADNAERTRCQPAKEAGFGP